MDQLDALRKVGFGLGVGETPPSDINTWLNEQLTGDFPAVGYANVSSAIVEPWPQALTFDLPERVTRCQDYWAEKIRVDESDLQGAERNTAYMQASRDYKVAEWDAIKFAQQPVLGANPVRERFKHFWLNHFIVGFSDISSREITGHYIDAAIYGSLTGSFADMLYGVTIHPAMLYYLDNIYNIGERSQRNLRCECGGLNDNLARELLELHTVSPERGYLEADIRDAAKVLAGWGAFFNEGWPEPIDDPWTDAYFPSREEPGPKSVLGQSFPSGKGALRQLTDMLAADPWTPRHLSAKLAQHFIGESASDEDRGAIEDAWIASNGDLPTIHRAVVDRALVSGGKKFLWPLTWLSQLLRISGASLYAGHDEAWNYFAEATRLPLQVLDEMGMNFWGIHQPNGFSDRRRDWISTEHLERRVRFSQMVYQQCRPQRSVDEIIDILQPGERTKSAVAQQSSGRDKFVVLACSPEFLEV